MEQEGPKEEEVKKETDEQNKIEDKKEEVKEEVKDEEKKEEKQEVKEEEKQEVKEEEKKEEKEEEKKEDIQEKKDEDTQEKKVEENKQEKEEDTKEEGNKEEKEEKKEEKEENKDKKGKKEKKKTEKVNLILTIDEENNKCVDCGKEHPTKVSINNGVIICEECALKHEELGYSISFVKDIDDDFDEYLLNFIVFGSNSKFKRFLEQEKVDANLPIEKKYLTKACFHYRNNLRNKVRGDKLQNQKNYEDPNEIEENPQNIYPEFENYKIKAKVMHDGALKTKKNTKLNKLGGSILSFGKKMYGGIKTGANFIEKKTEGATKSLKIGAGFVGKQVSHAYDAIKKNVIKGQKNENTKEEDSNKENPPDIEKNDNNVEGGKPLEPGEEVKEQNVEPQKEGNENEIQQQEKQDTDSNEEKIDI